MLVVVLALLTTSVQAATVVFSGASSGNGVSLLFDPAASVQVGDTLQVGLDAFTASSTNGIPALPVDNFSVTITALPGFLITSLDYSEIYNYTVAAGGVAGITLTGVLDGSTPLNPSGAFFTGGSGNNVGISLDTFNFGAGVTAVNFSISNTLIAFSPGAGTTTISKSAATLMIGTTPIPLPPAVGLLGAALVGLVTVGARRRN
ncbi:MAG: hypothetical protein AB7Q81_01325 [Gammaproteobacteria bacterium]